METKLDRILKSHEGDDKQIEIIRTDENRVIVEAPAGYGKTKTMMSQIAYLIVSHKLPNPKKILALTYSVNAAYGIKKYILTSSYEILSPNLLKDKVFVTNYHGFCRRVLSMYGYLIDDNLKNIKNFKSIDEIGLNIINDLNSNTLEFMLEFNKNVKEAKRKLIVEKISEYNKVVKENLLNKGYITFNSIITLTIELFRSFQSIRDFYRKLYPIVIVDEFQDTNILSWHFLQCLLSSETKLYLYGDSLQRIYGFIGAIPKVIQKTQRVLKMNKIELENNYRFRDNEEMLLLDKNIREIAKDINNKPKKNAEISLLLADNQDEEAKKIVDLCNSLLKENKKIVILFRQRGINANKLIEIFNNENIKFFYALFSDNDEEYIEFHKLASETFLTFLKNKNTINKSLIEDLNKNIVEKLQLKQRKQNELKKSLLKLFENYWNKVVFGEYNFLEKEEKIELIKDTLENNSLKQYLEYIEDNITITTVHSAKGLEWDYVILPYMEQYSFPSKKALCNICEFNNNECKIDTENNYSKDFLNSFYDELSVFYVAVTRAREKTFFSSNKSKNISCFLKLPGINLID